MMKIVKLFIVCMACIGFGTSAMAATSGSHYPFGVEGVNAATAPPPGFHYRMYNLFYDSDTLTDNSGNDVPIGFDISVYAQAHRFVHNTGIEFLGGQWIWDVIIPVVDKSVSIDAYGVDSSESFNLADITIEPLAIKWFGQQWDAVAALGVIAPTGDYDSTVPASLGLGYWSGILTLGGTYYFDEKKTLTFSALTRTLINGKQDETDITPGNEFHVEYGLGKSMMVADGLLITPGLSGYAYWQLTDDAGTTDTTKKSAYALGAEINCFYIPWLVQLNLRWNHEFESKNTTEGENIVLTFTKSF